MRQPAGVADPIPDELEKHNGEPKTLRDLLIPYAASQTIQVLSAPNLISPNQAYFSGALRQRCERGGWA